MRRARFSRRAARTGGAADPSDRGRSFSRPSSSHFSPARVNVGSAAGLKAVREGRSVRLRSTDRYSPPSDGRGRTEASQRMPAKARVSRRRRAAGRGGLLAVRPIRCLSRAGRSLTMR